MANESRIALPRSAASHAARKLSSVNVPPMPAGSLMKPSFVLSAVRSTHSIGNRTARQATIITVLAAQRVLALSFIGCASPLVGPPKASQQELDRQQYAHHQDAHDGHRGRQSQAAGLDARAIDLVVERHGGRA